MQTSRHEGEEPELQEQPKKEWVKPAMKELDLQSGPLTESAEGGYYNPAS